MSHSSQSAEIGAGIVLGVSCDAYAALDRALDLGARRPCLAPDVELARFTSRLHGAHAVLRNPRANTYIRASGAEAELVGLLNGTSSVDELVVAGLHRGGLRPETVAHLIGFLHRGGFLTTRWIDTYALLGARIAARPARLIDKAWRVLRTLTIPFPRAPEFIDAVYEAGGRLAFTWLAQVLMLAVSIAGIAAFIAESAYGGFTLLGRPTAGTAGALFALGLVALFVHEMGHALAVRHAGRRVLSAGFQLYLANPAFFIDSSDMVMAGRRQRAVNAIAGPYAESVIAGLAALGATLAGRSAVGHTLFRFAGLTYVFVLVNMVPFLELDGYWLFTDLIDVPDLRPRSLAFVRYELPARIRSRRSLSHGEWALTAFGSLGALFTAGALIVAWVFWFPIVRSFTEGLWRTGLVGQVLLVLLGVIVLGPIAHGCRDGAKTAAQRIRDRVEAVRFRAQRRWRVEAGEMIAALPGGDGLAPADLNDIAGRVKRRRFSKGEPIVRQGDAADAFYVLRRGRCAVVEDSPDGVRSVISHIGSGSSFGELALLDGMPRSATVLAETAGEAFVVDSGTFQRVLAVALSRPELAPAAWPITQVWKLAPFRNLTLSAISELASGGDWRREAANQEIIRQGEIGDTFYVVGSGQLEVERDGISVGTLRVGDYFGEVALLDDVPRTATVRTTMPTRLFVVSRDLFHRVVATSFRHTDLIAHPLARTHSARFSERS